MLSVLELVTLQNVLLSYVVPLALWGIPLLWRYLSRKAVTRRQAGRAAWTVFVTGFWILFGNTFFHAHERGMISLPTFIVAEAALFAVVAGSWHLVDGFYPDEKEA